MTKGNLYLIPTPLSGELLSLVLPEGTLTVIRRLKVFIVEEVRTARRFLIKAGITTPIDDLQLMVLNEHSQVTDLHNYLESALNGMDIGLLSEAGTPCVADPGSVIVRQAHDLGIRTIPLTGPSSILLALMASGFNGQNFTFHGYLPADKNLRIKRIREIEKIITERDQTQIFIETPYRNLQLFESIIQTCKGQTQLCLASDITGNEEMIRTMSIADWRKIKPDIHKKPTIFLLFH